MTTAAGRSGTEATLTLRLDPRPDGPTSLSVLISEIMVDATAPTLPVEVVADGRCWRSGPWNRIVTPHQRTVELPAEGDPSGWIPQPGVESRTPRTPASMGWSSDLRPLGIRLTRAVIGGRGLLDLVARRVGAASSAGLALRLPVTARRQRCEPV